MLLHIARKFEAKPSFRDKRLNSQFRNWEVETRLASIMANEIIATRKF